MGCKLTWTVINARARSVLHVVNEAFDTGTKSPGEIKRRQVSWTLMKKLDCHLRVQARSRGGRWCWTLKRAQERSRAREVELGSESWTCLLLLSCFSAAVLRTLYLSVSLLRTAVQTAIAYSTLVAAAQWRRNTALTLPLFWRRSTASSVFRVGARGRVFTLSPTLLFLVATGPLFSR